MVKNYILDTNILISSPNAVYGFEDNNVIITGTTLQELDKLKTAPGETGYNARESIRNIEKIMTDNDADSSNIFVLDNGGRLILEPDGVDPANIPNGYDINIPDNRIISTVKTLMSVNSNDTYILVTNDVSMRVNARVCDVNVESYKNDHLSSEEKYTGKTTIEIPYSIINSIYAEKMYDISLIKDKDLSEFFNSLFENEFITLKSGTATVLTIHKTVAGKKCLCKIPDEITPYGITPKNTSQRFALTALMAPVDEIPLVILSGAAGTAKTFLSLAAGLDQTNAGVYNKVLISRNNITLDDDFGYLPGEMEDKMRPLLAPFYDNLESLIRGKDSDESNENIQMQIDDYFATGTVAVCPLAYMRGRSITGSFLIVDEAQNASRSQMRDIITRVGKGTKLVICGDPTQIDNPKLDKCNNGLIYAAEMMKGSPKCAQIMFNASDSVRSSLATEVLKRLKI